MFFSAGMKTAISNPCVIVIRELVANWFSEQITWKEEILSVG